MIPPLQLGNTPPPARVTPRALQPGERNGTPSSKVYTHKNHNDIPLLTGCATNAWSRVFYPEHYQVLSRGLAAPEGPDILLALCLEVRIANVPEELAVALVVGRGQLCPQQLQVRRGDARQGREGLDLLFGGVFVRRDEPRSEVPRPRLVLLGGGGQERQRERERERERESESTRARGGHTTCSLLVPEEQVASPVVAAPAATTGSFQPSRQEEGKYRGTMPRNRAFCLKRERVHLYQTTFARVSKQGRGDEPRDSI